MESYLYTLGALPFAAGLLGGLCPGVFGRFTMYLSPLFPTLLRTTGAVPRIFLRAGNRVWFGEVDATEVGGITKLAIERKSVLR